MHAIKRPRSTPTKPTERHQRPPAFASIAPQMSLLCFLDAQRRIMDEPCMPSSAHVARLQIPQDALDVRLPLPPSTHRQRRRVYINAQQRSTDKQCMPSSAHATRLLRPRDAYDVCLPAPQSAFNTSTPLYMLKKVLPM